MADQEFQGTEEATPRRREDARGEGQVVFSPDLTASLGLLTACGVFLLFGDSIGPRLMHSIRVWLRAVPDEDWTEWHVSSSVMWLSSELVGTCAAIVLSIMAVGLIVSFLQVGFVVSLKPLMPDWSRLLPSNGWSRITSLESVLRGGQGAAKILLLLSVSIIVLWLKRHELSVNHFDTVGAVAEFGWNLGLRLCLVMSAVALGLAITDYIIRWFRNEQRLKMTREEIKQEQKDDTGDPQVRAAVRKRQRDARKRQSVKDVPKATVIITNPTHLAIAIQYERGMSAPKIVAKGAGDFAKNIVRIAKRHNIPVMERKPLARALFASVEVGQEIPFEFFRAVAEIIAQIYRARQTAA